jgi:hypothetical protein
MCGPSAEQWTAIFTAGLFGVGVVALLYARGQLRESHNQAQIQHLMSFVKDFDSEQMRTCCRTYAQNRLAGTESAFEADRLLDFFETIGLLVKRGYLDATDVWELFANDIICLYEDTRSWIKEERQEDPPAYSNFVSLAEQVRDIEIRNHGSLAHPTSQEVREFWESLTDTGTAAPKTIRRRRRRPSRFRFPR